MRIRFRSRAILVGVTAGTVIGVATLPIAASAATAGASGAKFTFAGSLSGVLTLPTSGCAQGTNGSGGQFGFSGKLKGMTSAIANYTVTIVDPGTSGGTWTKFPTGQDISVILEGQINNSGYSWIGTSGKLTTKGSTGSLNMQFIPVKYPLSGKSGKGNVHIKGTWSCPS